MNVLFITHYTAMLGANRSMLQLIIELRNLGIVPTVLIPKSNDRTGLITELRSNNIEFIEAPIRWIKHSNRFKCFLNYLISFPLNHKIFKLLKNRRFDIVHTNSSVINIGVYLSSKLRTKHIWHLREFGDVDYNLKTPFGKWFQRYLYKGENHFIAISKKIYNHYKPYINNQHIEIIYNGINPPTDKFVKHKNDIVNLCIVGIININKGQFEVLEAINELVNIRKIKNLRLTIIGSGEQSELNRLSKYIKNNNLNPYVEFKGYRKDVFDILQNMDIGIMASSNEAFGRVTIEYMMAGLAVIASDSGANDEIVKDRETGLLYEKKNIRMLADKILDLINDRYLMLKISKTAYSYSLTNFSSKNNSHQIYELYQSLILK